MKYVDYNFFSSVYPGITESEFDRIGYEAERVLENATTGIDGVKKLRVAFPTDEDDAEAVKRCVCKLIDAMHQIEEAQAAAGYFIREDGTMTGKTISSVSSGSESVSYSSGGASTSTFAAAAADDSQKAQLLYGIVRSYLGGVTDANGVNLLFMGRYPHDCKHLGN